MNRRFFLTGVAAGVATAIAGPGSEKLFFFGEDTTEIISGVTGPFRMRSAGAIWNLKAEYFTTILNNPLVRIGPLFKESGQ